MMGLEWWMVLEHCQKNTHKNEPILLMFLKLKISAGTDWYTSETVTGYIDDNSP